jgi:radical SAM-linked protein
VSDQNEEAEAAEATEAVEAAEATEAVEAVEAAETTGPVEGATAQAAPLTRMRIHHARGAELRYVGNLDMQLVWERTLRRARLPVAFSQGFSPRPRFHMAAALPLGFTSRCEMLDLWLNEDLEPETLRQAVQASAPPGLLVQRVERVELREPALQTLVCAAEYSALLRETPPGFDPGEAVQALLGETSLPREWRKKPYDLRPLIFALESAPAEATDGAGAAYPRLEMRLSAREGATGRPEEVLAAMGLDPTTARVERTRLILNPHDPSHNLTLGMNHA